MDHRSGLRGRTMWQHRVQECEHCSAEWRILSLPSRGAQKQHQLCCAFCRNHPPPGQHQLPLYVPQECLLSNKFNAQNNTTFAKRPAQRIRTSVEYGKVCSSKFRIDVLASHLRVGVKGPLLLPSKWSQCLMKMTNCDHQLQV